MLNLNSKFPLTLPELPYKSNELEPYISSTTLSFHHGKHHKIYIDNSNKIILENGLESLSVGELIAKSRQDKNLQGLFNNVAQSWNHAFYWECMKKESKKPTGEFLSQITKDFDSYDGLKSELVKHGLAQFGSGWVWIVWDHNKSKLSVLKTANADLPNSAEYSIILTIDVWEHAYYLDYQNNRKDYLDKFLDVLANWEFAQNNFIHISK
ncbi:Superoxide dismutase [Fe] [Candidatus Cyrtobacter comes]|uniref:Superoxide dismutase n=1 Tax=Candidatus Cyrtobacter comes TaxID=675776 RepID=A0ABU5L9J0_9RICK|nr:superoxide dismutase [Candidatus Cyrtobacter comes]MDZ5762504.1 Superoxide dismutase [Fe] [Candidatus Cyrtobacter comes]